MKDGLVSLETVVVADPDNPPDPSEHGAVSYPFKI